ncbi:hypothetical protein AAFF_G00084410 [Aldrovandia affinis]|uniref:Uncharacterized protein n=1 Tax=Aldrovandia affinis TaxID=143900 RepID=A0AAD7RX09_9TELE|nr:hypothetical protein AAFF_G00084410 [Aldrovandia affinis]
MLVLSEGELKAEALHFFPKEHCLRFQQSTLLLLGYQGQGLVLHQQLSITALKTSAGEGSVQYVLRMKDRLETYREDARKNLQKPQWAQKQWYDRCARHYEYKPGQKVSPSHGNK